MGQYYNNYPLVLLSGWNGWGIFQAVLISFEVESVNYLHCLIN